MSSMKLEFVMVKKGREVSEESIIFMSCERTERLIESAESHEGYYIRKV